MSQGNSGGHRPTIKTLVVEFGDENNRQILLSTKREKLRGKFSIAGLHQRKNVPGRSVGESMSRMPDIPGMRMELIFSKNEIRIFDPLADDPDLLDKINAVGRDQGISSRPYKAVPERKEEMDNDTFKTMVREIVQLVKAESATVVDGDIPKLEAVDKLPGRYLNDPGNTTTQGKAKFEPVPA